MDTEQVWYYIKDGQKVGPISLADMRHLQQQNLLKGSDLVWKTGFENWVAIKTVPELAQAPRQSEEKVEIRPQEPAPREQRTPAPRSSQSSMPAGGILNSPLSLFRPLMQPMMFLGLMLVIGGKGCDSLNVRWASRVEAIAQSDQRNFDRKYEMMRLEDDADFSEINEKEQEEREKKQSTWLRQQTSADNARTNVRTLGVFFELLFVFGSLMLAAGLAIAGFTESGPNRWVCLVILGIIVFSIYVGGLSWTSSVVNSIGGLGI